MHSIVPITLGLLVGVGIGAIATYVTVVQKPAPITPESLIPNPADILDLPPRTGDAEAGNLPTDPIVMPPLPDLTPPVVVMPPLPVENPLLPGGLTPPPILHAAPDKGLMSAPAGSAQTPSPPTIAPEP